MLSTANSESFVLLWLLGDFSWTEKRRAPIISLNLGLYLAVRPARNCLINRSWALHKENRIHVVRRSDLLPPYCCSRGSVISPPSAVRVLFFRGVVAGHAKFRNMTKNFGYKKSVQCLLPGGHTR